jgi:hypothetical protein
VGMTVSYCICGHGEHEHVMRNLKMICCGDFGECDCEKFEWDEDSPDVA